MAHFGQYRQSVLPLTDNGTAGHSHPLHSSKSSGLPVRGIARSVGTFSLSLTGVATVETNMWTYHLDPDTAETTPVSQMFQCNLSSLVLDAGGDETSALFHRQYGGWSWQSTRAWADMSVRVSGLTGRYYAGTFTCPDNDPPIGTYSSYDVTFNVTAGILGLVLPLDSVRPEDILYAARVNVGVSCGQGSHLSISRDYLCLATPDNPAKPVFWRDGQYSTVVPFPPGWSEANYVYASMYGDKGVGHPQDISLWPDFIAADIGGQIDGNYDGFVEPGAGDPSYKRMTVSNLALSLTRLPDS